MSRASIWWEIQFLIPRTLTAAWRSATISSGMRLSKFTTAWASLSPISNAFWKAVAEVHSCNLLSGLKSKDLKQQLVEVKKHAFPGTQQKCDFHLNHRRRTSKDVIPHSEPLFLRISSWRKKLNAFGARRVRTCDKVMPQLWCATSSNLGTWHHDKMTLNTKTMKINESTDIIIVRTLGKQRELI